MAGSRGKLSPNADAAKRGSGAGRAPKGTRLRECACRPGPELRQWINARRLSRRSLFEVRHAPVSFPHDHARPQHGRRPRPVARHRHEGRRFRQADRRHRQFLHPVRPRPRPPEGPRPARRARDRGGRRRRQGVQHHRRRRRHRHGPRRHALFAALARADRRQRRIHGQRPLRRRAGLHLQLRQDHARHADGRAAAQHSRRLRLRRADGGGQGHAGDRRRGQSTSSTRWSPRPIRKSATPTSR